MKAATIVFIWGLCAFGIMLSIRSGLMAQKARDWWGVVGQVIMVLVAISFGIIATLITLIEF